MLQSIRQISPVARAIVVIGVVAALVTSITFAALQSQATLTNTTITSGTASLQLYDFSIPDWASSAPGFTVTGLVPGEGSDPQAFYFRNNGDVDLIVSAELDGTPPALTNIAALDDVEVVFDCFGATGSVPTTLAALDAGPVSLTLTLPAGATGNAGDPNTVGNCNATFDLDPAGVSGSSASVAPFTIKFTGDQVVAP